MYSVIYEYLIKTKANAVPMSVHTLSKVGIHRTFYKNFKYFSIFLFLKFVLNIKEVDWLISRCKYFKILKNIYLPTLLCYKLPHVGSSRVIVNSFCTLKLKILYYLLNFFLYKCSGYFWLKFFKHFLQNLSSYEALSRF